MRIKNQNHRGIVTLALGALAVTVAQTSMAAEEMSHEHHQHQEQVHATHAGSGPHGTHIHHQHGKGNWMFEYRFMRMEMDGLLDGTNSVDTRDISGANMGPSPNPNFPYMMAPTEMTMDMHMLMAMYGFTENLTGMIMANYLANDMDMVMHMYMPNGMPMGDMTGSMDTSGVGDTRVSAMYNVTKNWTGTLGLSLPTGSIDEKVDMTMTGTNINTNLPMPSVTRSNIQAPYAMQLGSGTYDLIPSVTYKDESGDNGWGGQFEYTFRIGENDNEYSLGDKLELTAWYVRRFGKYVHLAGRLDYLDWGEIDGKDKNIPAAMTPSGYMVSTDDPKNYGGRRLDALLGLTGVFGMHRVGLEVGAPVYQDLNGPQMETKMIYSVGYQLMIM
ncbi:hypothetical protein [Kaarinaea lacus]